MQKPLQACAAPHSLACSFLLVATPPFARHILFRSKAAGCCGASVLIGCATRPLRAAPPSPCVVSNSMHACMPATLSIYACVAVHVPVPVASRDDTLDCWEIASARVEPSSDTLKGCHKIYA